MYVSLELDLIILIITRIAEVMTMIGEQIGKLHKADVIHGDLTTSNMMLRRSSRITLDSETKTSQIVSGVYIRETSTNLRIVHRY